MSLWQLTISLFKACGRILEKKARNFMLQGNSRILLTSRCCLQTTLFSCWIQEGLPAKFLFSAKRQRFDEGDMLHENSFLSAVSRNQTSQCLRKRWVSPTCLSAEILPRLPNVEMHHQSLEVLSFRFYISKVFITWTAFHVFWYLNWLLQSCSTPGLCKYSATSSELPFLPPYVLPLIPQVVQGGSEMLHNSQTKFHFNLFKWSLHISHFVGKKAPWVWFSSLSWDIFKNMEPSGKS